MGDMGGGKGYAPKQEGAGACGAVGIGTGTGAVFFSIPEGACACGAEGRIALC